MRLVLFPLLICLATAAGAGENLLPNGGFEGAFVGKGIAQGWADNSGWADLDVAYSRESDNPHSGGACQRITCPRFESGAVQMTPTVGVPLRKGGIYRVRAWLRGDPVRAAVQLRLAPSPYTVYVEKDLLLGSDWQQVEYFWTSKVGDPKARLMLRFTQMGAICVDDISVEEVGLEEALKLVAPPRPGNLLHNGDFAFGPANWLVWHCCDDWKEAEVVLVTPEFPEDHGPTLKVVVPEGVNAAMSSDAVEVSPGHPVAIHCRLKADKPTKVKFHSNHCGKEVHVIQDWQTVDAKGRVGFSPQPYDFVRFWIAGPATVWIGGVQLRQDTQTEGADRPRAAILSDRHPLALYHDGEKPTLHILSSSPTAMELTWRVEDFWGEIVREGILYPGAGRCREDIPCTGLPRGGYRASIGWKQKGKDCRNACLFALLPPPERHGDVLASPFGAHFSVDPTGLKLARAVGCRWLRLHPPNHTKWRVVEPKKGEWAWRDEPIRIAREAGLALCGSLDRCPTWASSAPPGTPDNCFYTGAGAWLPRDWNEWEDYVARTVRRHRSDIHIWEIWNEPNLTQWLIPREGQTRAQAYVELLKHTTPIVKREDPTAVVIGGCVAGAMTEASDARKFAFDIISLGALDLMDVFSFHHYIGRPVDEGGEPIDVWMAKLRERMRTAGRELPIINSEGGYANPGTCLDDRPCDPNTLPPDKMARWLVRQYVSQMVLGIERFFFYNFFIDGSPVIHEWEGFVEGDGQPRPNVPAYATMTWLLDGASFQRTERPTDDVWVHHFATPRGVVAVAWARTGATARQKFANAKQGWDLMGAPLTIPDDKMLTVADAPIYILLSN